MESLSIKFLKTGHSVKIDLERRLTFVTGLSGSGKTSFVRLMNTQNNENVEHSSTIQVFFFVNANGFEQLVSVKDRIVILDDYGALQHGEFINFVKGYAVSNNLWFLIFGREDSNIPVSFSSIYVMKSVGREFTATKLSIAAKTYKLSGFDLILVEDSKSGFEFVNRLNNTNAVVESTYGASNIYKKLKNLRESGIDKLNIFIFVDMASYGVDFLQLKALLSKKEYKGYNVCLMTDYECFEELLLRTNMLNGSVDLSSLEQTDANNYVSWENFYEDVLNKATEGKLFRAYHGSMTRCYVEKCCYLKNEFQGDKCEFHYMHRKEEKDKLDKFKFLLEGTKYERLLDFH